MQSSQHEALRLFVVGATGGIGRALVQQAKDRGHRVTAFARSPEKLASLAGDGITVRRGDPLNASDLQVALPSHDAVLSALGAPGVGQTTVHQDGARSAVTAMRVLGMRRLLVVSGAMLFKDAGLVPAILRRIILRNIAEDLAEMERIVTTSDLDWTIVRPPRLTTGPLTKKYAHAESRMPERARTWISRSDVADFLLEEVVQGVHVQQIVGIASMRRN
jgi:putative NADH-flavin reductase